jgi:hypothetical protein
MYIRKKNIISFLSAKGISPLNMQLNNNKKLDRKTDNYSIDRPVY